MNTAKFKTPVKYRGTVAYRDEARDVSCELALLVVHLSLVLCHFSSET